MFNQEHTLPLFIDKGITVTIKGDALQPNSIRISGGEANEELNLFKEQTRHLTDSAAYIAQADSFIRRHPFSQVSVYLFDTYFVQTSHPDYQRMNELINSMSGILHDHPLIQSIQKKLDNAIKSDTGRYISSFRIKNLKGEYLTSYRFRDKVMVVSFWATWNEPSLKLQKELKALRGKLKKEDIAFVNVALDMDLKRWKEAIANDTIDTEHACDGEGWEGTTARLFGIEKLPMTVVINPQRKVVVRSADIQELTGHIEATLKKEKERKSKIKKR